MGVQYTFFSLNSMRVRFEASKFCYKFHAHADQKGQKQGDQECPWLLLAFDPSHSCARMRLTTTSEIFVAATSLTKTPPGVVVSNSAPDQWKVIFVFSLSPKVGFKRLYGANLESPVLTHKTQN